MRPIDSISVLLPTWQAMEFLERVFDALSAQECSLPWDVHVIDSGSTDGTPESLEARAKSFPVPLHVTRISQQEFDHGDTRNQLAAGSAGELLVLLTQDAIPSRSDWLASLARNFEDCAVGAAYCRNVPREDAQLLTRVFSRSDPGYQTQRSETRMPAPEEFERLTSDERRLLYNFNDVASAVRRELWERHPFPRTMMGEDVLMCRAIIHAGYSVVYDAHATVDHSHDYGPEKMHWRGEVDARFNAEWLDRICIGSTLDMEALSRRLVDEDMAILDSEHELSATEREDLLARARELRGALCNGLLEGARSTLRYSSTSMRKVAALRLLFVVGSGGTQQQVAGVPGLARALEARGHTVRIVHLKDCGIPAGSDFGQALAGDPTADPLPAFEALLAEQPFDVVHFHGLRGEEACLLKAAHQTKLGSLVSWVDPAGLPDAHALGRTDQCLVESLEVRESLLNCPSIEASRVVYSPSPTVVGRDGEPNGNVGQQQALAHEYRYRAIACIEQKNVFLDCVGCDAERTTGVCEAQDANYLLLHPGAVAEYRLSGMLEGAARIAVEQYQLAGESNVQLAGHLLVDGVKLAQLPSPGPAREDRIVRQLIDVELPPGTLTLQVATARRLPWRRQYLRIMRLRVTH